MNSRLVAAGVVIILSGSSFLLAACSSSSSKSSELSSTSAATTLTSGSAPSSSATQTDGAPPGQPGDGGGSTQQYTPTGKYSQNGGSVTKRKLTIVAKATNQSAVLVSNSGTLKLLNSTIRKTGDSQSGDESSFYGLNAGVLAQSGSKIIISGTTVTTSGLGANGVFATGSGTSITMTNSTIKASGRLAHGVDATNGGSITIKNVNITTTDANGAAIATDRGGGTITVKGGRMTTHGTDSPGIYSTGTIKVNGARISATGSEAVVIEGANSVTLTDTTLHGSAKWGVLIYQSMSGDAQGTRGVFTMTGGALSAAVGPLFHVTNTTAVITLKDVNASAVSGTLIDASADRWGSSGSNGGTVLLTADDQTLAGDVLSDSISSISLTLKNGSKLTGKIASAALTLDADSSWIVTADSTLTSLADSAGISGSTITNIVGNGHTVTYDASLAANGDLGGKTYTLAGGGQLVPK